MKEFIDSIITEPAEESMTLFVSYAHREALICRLIVYSDLPLDSLRAESPRA